MKRQPAIFSALPGELWWGGAVSDGTMMPLPHPPIRSWPLCNGPAATILSAPIIAPTTRGANTAISAVVKRRSSLLLYRDEYECSVLSV